MIKDKENRYGGNMRIAEKRDIEELTSSALTEKYNTPQADIFVLFGGSIICGGDVLAQKIREELN